MVALYGSYTVSCSPLSRDRATRIARVSSLNLGHLVHCTRWFFSFCSQQSRDGCIAKAGNDTLQHRGGLPGAFAEPFLRTVEIEVAIDFDLDRLT